MNTDCKKTHGNHVLTNLRADRLADPFDEWFADVFTGKNVQTARCLVPPCRGFNKFSKREREFNAGRRCARNAILPLGRDQEIPVAKDRSPVWPEGIVGSISHSDRWAWAVAAESSEVRSVGIDTECIVDSSSVRKLENEIATPSEWQLADRLGHDSATAFTIVFSAKESFYKCWYPITREFFGFHQAVVCDADPSKLTLRLHSNNPNCGRGPQKLDVNYLIQNTDIFTATRIQTA